MLFDDLSPKNGRRRSWIRAYGVLALLVSRVVPFSTLHVWLEAKIDGLRNQTPADEKRSPFIRQMEEFFGKRKIKIAGRYGKIKASLQAKARTAIGVLHDLMGELKDKVRPEYDAASETLKKAVDDCTDHHHTNRVAYWLLIGFLCVVDFPTQVAAFNADGSAGWMVWGICAGIAVITGAAAHFIGVAFRREGRLTKTLAILLCLLFVVGFACIALLRMASFQQLSTIEDMGIEIPAELTALVYGVVNILILLTAIAYSCHVHEPKSETCRKKKKTAAKRYRLASKQYEGLMQAIQKWERVLNELEVRLDVLPQDEELKKAELDATFREKHQAYIKTYERTADLNVAVIVPPSPPAKDTEIGTPPSTANGIPVAQAPQTQAPTAEATKRS